MDNFDNMKKTSHVVGELYKDLTYFDLYGGSVFGFFILILILFLVYAYSSVMVNVQPIKDDWVAQRCNPRVIPFAGLINKPDGVSTFDFTQQNFTFCMQNILTSITGEALQPLTVVTGGLGTLFDDIRESLNYSRTMIANVRTNMASMAQEVLGRVLNILAPLQMIMIAFVDSMEKIKGILTAGLYTSLGTYYTLKSLLGAIVQFIVMILMILAALILGLWIIPFTWPAAITGTAIFLATSIPLLIIMIFMNQVLHVNITSPIPGLPQRPHLCFDKDTLLEMNDHTFLPISKIKVGDVLRDGNKVTTTLKVVSTNSQMFSLKGNQNIVVSGSHLVKYKKKWIHVSSHPDRISISNYDKPFLYCMNTTSKRISIGKYIFADWDDVVDDNDISLWFGKKCGLVKTTPIILLNDEVKEIKDICIGDVLKNGEKVIGTVQTEGQTCASYYLDGILFVDGAGLTFCDENNDIVMNLKNQDIDGNKFMYHLLTDSKRFTINGIEIYDYNHNILE